MQLARIQMQSSSAQIGFTTRNSVLEIQQPQAEMNLRQEPSILQISQDAGVLSLIPQERERVADYARPCNLATEITNFRSSSCLMLLPK